MLFVTGRTKLTGLISSLDEKYALNSGVWTTVDDVKIAWAVFTIASTGCTMLYCDGFDASITREASGVATLSYTSTYDAVPLVIAQAIATSGAAASRRYAMVEDGTTYTRSGSAQTVYVLEDDCATMITDANETATVVIMALGVDANTTSITNNSTSTPLNSTMLNRILAVGNYINPDSLGDTVPGMSGGYTSDGGDPGDTLTNISNTENHARGGEGSYTTDYTTNYIYTPYGMLVSVLGDGGTPVGGYGVATSTTDTLTVTTTVGTDNVEADENYCFVTFGMMEVA